MSYCPDKVQTTFYNTSFSEIEIHILNLPGQIVQKESFKLHIQGKQDIRINLENLAHGFYYIKLSEGDNQSVIKFEH